MSTLLTQFTRPLIILAAVLALASPTYAGPRGKGKGGAASGKEHPAMHEAIDALHSAKSSAKPIEDLNAALHRLKQGNDNKEGYRVRAIGLVEKAMGELQAKHQVDANKLIDEAITVIEKAVAVSPDRR